MKNLSPKSSTQAIRMKSPLILALLAAPCLQAVVIQTGVLNIAIPQTFSGIYLDLDNGATGSDEFTGWDVNFAFGGSEVYFNSSFQPIRLGTGNLDAIVNLPQGAIVGSGSTFATNPFGASLDHLGLAVNQFQNGSQGYIGFAYMTNASPGPVTGPHYGWLRVELTPNGATGKITGWAYESTAGSSIIVPEPSTWAALAGAAVLGLAFLRRRR